MVLPRRRARAARAVADSARAETHRGARCDTVEERVGQGGLARPLAAGRVFRHRLVSLLRRGRTSSVEGAAVADVSARRRSRAGTARDAAGTRPRHVAPWRGRLPTALAVLVVRAPASTRARVAARTG